MSSHIYLAVVYNWTTFLLKEEPKIKKKILLLEVFDRRFFPSVITSEPTDSGDILFGVLELKKVSFWAEQALICLALMAVWR